MSVVRTGIVAVLVALGLSGCSAMEPDYPYRALRESAPSTQSWVMGEGSDLACGDSYYPLDLDPEKDFDEMGLRRVDSVSAIVALGERDGHPLLTIPEGGPIGVIVHFNPDLNERPENPAVYYTAERNSVKVILADVDLRSVETIRICY